MADGSTVGLARLVTYFYSSKGNGRRVDGQVSTNSVKCLYRERESVDGQWSGVERIGEVTGQEKQLMIDKGKRVMTCHATLKST
jgi:hypothetical protein